MRTADLTGAQLDYHTARAEGVPAADLEIRATGTLCVRNMPPLEGHAIGMLLVLDYSTNWALSGPLVEKHGMGLIPNRQEWTSMRGGVGATAGPTPLIAICLAVVRAAFGDEVEDLPCA